MKIIAGVGATPLADEIAAGCGVQPTARRIERFPDGEWSVGVDPVVRGGDVFVVQPTALEVHDRLWVLLLLADACERAGAASVTAVIPYFAYARQDRRSEAGMALGVRVASEVLACWGCRWRP
jgi:ribose-phosphate pyrophosphokinase